MAKIHGWKREKQIREALEYNVDKPPRKRRKVPYWNEIDKDSDESSDTTDTGSSGEDEKCPFFERSQKITPHALVHFPDQVIMGGTHNFHDTSAAESAHPFCIQQAARRSRTYHGNNLTSSKMLDYLMDYRLLQKLTDLAHSASPLSDDDEDLADNGRFPLLSLTITGCITVPTFDRCRRGLIRPTALHRTVWDSILCEGVRLSMREVVQLIVSHLGIEVNMENSSLLLQRCSCQLGWHVRATTLDGTTRHFRVGPQ